MKPSSAASRHLRVGMPSILFESQPGIHVQSRGAICAGCLRDLRRNNPALRRYQYGRSARRALHLKAWAGSAWTSKTRPTVSSLGCRALSNGAVRAFSQAQIWGSGSKQERGLATVQSGYTAFGPLEEYDERVHSHRLRDDEHQRSIVQHLQDLHEMLRDYQPPKVVHPSIESLTPAPKNLFGSLFSRTTKKKTGNSIPENLPKGLYMYGDVGSGKTMLMDLFYDTLPPNITSKNRIHFHNFMQDVHKRLHVMKMKHGNDFDAIPFVAADIAENSSVLCFDEFQCTDVADAMILRRLIESLMSHGVVIITTSNRHPDDLYKNGIQRASFVPCINLLKARLRVINLDSSTDYRKIPRPPSGVYHHPLDKGAINHAEKWFKFLGDPKNDPPHKATQVVWGREIEVPKASGRCAWFSFDELIGRATGAADYIELMRSYDAFIVTDVPGMTHRSRDLARRFITFIDAVYESRAKLVLTTAVPLTNLFLSRNELDDALESINSTTASSTSDPSSTAAIQDLSRSSSSSNAPSSSQSSTTPPSEAHDHSDVDDVMRHLMDDLGMNMTMLKNSSLFSGDEERFAFARAISRLTEMGGQDWIERGLGLEKMGGLGEKEAWGRVRSRWREDML